MQWRHTRVHHQNLFVSFFFSLYIFDVNIIIRGYNNNNTQKYCTENHSYFLIAVYLIKNNRLVLIDSWNLYHLYFSFCAFLIQIYKSQFIRVNISLFCYRAIWKIIVMNLFLFCSLCNFNFNFLRELFVQKVSKMKLYNRTDGWKFVILFNKIF